MRQIISPAGTVTFTRDAFGRATSATTGGVTSTFGFDENGNLDQVIPQPSVDHAQSFDFRDLLTSYTSPEVPIDNQGTMGRHQTTFEWDGERKLLSIDIPGQNTLTRSFSTQPNLRGQLRQVRGVANEAGSDPFTVTYSYTNETDSSAPPGELGGVLRGTHTTSFQWFAGQIVKVDTGDTLEPLDTTRLTRTLDDALQTTQLELTVDGATTNASFERDLDGLLTCMTPNAIPAGETCSAQENHLSIVNDAASPLVNQITAGSVPSDRIVEEFDHNEFGELASRMTYSGRVDDGSNIPGDLLLGQTWSESGAERDGVGRVVQRTVTRDDGTPAITKYSYDDRGQLWKVEEGAEAEVYVFDDRGNRLCVNEYADASTAPSSPPDSAAACAEEWVYDSQDQLRSAGNVTYEYTDRGTLWKKTVDEGQSTEAVTEYTYDLQGGLTKVVSDDGDATNDIEYVIDGLGRRVAKKVGGAVTNQYVWSTDLRIEASVDSSGFVTRYIYGDSPNSPEMVITPDLKVYRVVSDLRGSPLLVVNINDSTDRLLEVEYDAWGKVTRATVRGVDLNVGDPASMSAWPIAHGFAGGLFDAGSGLVRFGERDFSPELGRWTAKDPILFDGGQSNLYAYIGNAPIDSTDPDGLKPGFRKFLHNFTRAWRDHIHPRHISTTAMQYLHKSKFVPRKRSSIARDAHQAVLRGDRTLQPNGNTLYQLDTGRPIGIEGESIMNVVFGPNGRLITSFPSHAQRGFFLTLFDVDGDGLFSPFDFYQLLDPGDFYGAYCSENGSGGA